MGENIKKNRTFFIAGVVLLVIGIICWFLQFSNIVSIDYQEFPWGIYIAAFLLFAGAASGLAIIAFIAELGWIPSLQQRRSELYIGAVILYVAAGIAILLDLGKPLRVLEMVLSSNFKSMMTWDFYFLVAAVISSFCCIFLKGRALSLISALFALGVVVVEGLLFWEDHLLVTIFLADALLLSFALILFVGKGDQVRIKTAMMATLFITFTLTLAHMISGLYAGSAETYLLVKGAFAPLFLGALIIGIIVPFGILCMRNQQQFGVRAVAILVSIGIFAHKLATVLASEAIGVADEVATYSPELIEFGGTIGVLGLAIVLYTLLKPLLLKSEMSKAEHVSVAK